MRSALALSHNGKPVDECTHCHVPSQALIIVNLYHGCEWQLCPACSEQMAASLSDGLAKWKALVTQ